MTRRRVFAFVVLSVAVLLAGGWYRWRMPRDSQFVATHAPPLESAGAPLPATVPITPKNAGQIVQLARLNDGSAMALQVSADGRLLAIGMNNVGVAIYNAQTLERLELVEMPYQADQLRDPDQRVAITADGNTVAAGLGQVAHIRTANNQLIKLNPFDTENLAFSPDGTTLATVGEQIRIWRTTNGALERSFENPAFPRSSFEAGRIAFSPDGMHLLVANQEIVVVLRAGDGEQIRSFDGAVGAFFPDGDRVATSYGTGVVNVGRLSDGTQTTFGSMVEHADDPSGDDAMLAISADGSFLAASAWDGQVRVWRVNDGMLVSTFSLGRNQSGKVAKARGLAFTPDNAALTVLAGNGMLKQHRLSDGTLVREMELSSESTSHLRFSDNSTQLVASSAAHITTWQLSNLSVVATQPLSSSLAWEDVYANNEALLTYRDNKPFIWQPQDGTAPPVMNEGKWYVGALAPDGTLLAASNIETDTITLLRVADGSVARSLTFTPEARDRVNRITSTFSADGALLVATNGRSAWVWQISDGTLVRSFPVLDRNDLSPLSMAITLSPDAAMLATADSDGVKVWNVATGKHLATLANGSNTLPLTACFSPDGRLLAVADYRGAVRVWGVR